MLKFNSIVGISLLVIFGTFLFSTSWWKLNKEIHNNIVNNTVDVLPSKFFQDGKKLDNYNLSGTDDRASHVKHVCTRWHNRTQIEKIDASMFKHIIYNDKYKVLYCYIPKIACTNWKRMFLVLSGRMNTSNPLELDSDKVHTTYGKYFTSLSSLNPQKIQYRLKHYFKFMFVREPFERLLSAYNDKLGKLSNNSYYQNLHGKRIVKKYRPNVKETETKTDGTGVKFGEFVQYLIDQKQKDGLDEHWDHYNHLCQPCKVNYDFIGKYESLEDDSEAIIKHIHATNVIRFPKRSQTYKHNMTKHILYDFYKQLSPKTLFKLWNLYYSDFVLFDYKVPESLYNLANFTTVT